MYVFSIVKKNKSVALEKVNSFHYVFHANENYQPNKYLVDALMEEL